MNGLTLDIGCGNGEFLEKSKGIGIEMHPLGLKNCKKKGLYVVKANATKMPFKSNSFDSIHTNSVIDHIRTRPEQIEMVNEIKRVSKDKSKIYLVVNDISTIGFKYYIDYTHGEPFTKISICSLLRDKKFIIQKTGYIPQIPRGLGRLCYMKKAFEIVAKLYGSIKKRQLEIIAINNKK